MGSIKKFDLNRIIQEYKTPFFFETGTWKGDSVVYARQSPFEKIISAEIIPELAAAAGERFKSDSKVKIVTGDSASVLEKELPGLYGNCLFWLDAHFPGADAGLTTFEAETNEEVRLPLQTELEIIKKSRAKYKDVLIIDDLRIYEEGPYENGNAPVDTLPKKNRSIRFINEYFDDSHIILKSWLDEGYILLFPKKTYNRKHFKIKNLFKQKPLAADYYLAEQIANENDL
jgi:hypothetical protein